MAKKPDTPCSICGTLLWSGRTSLPAERRVCWPCRRVRPVPHGHRDGSKGRLVDCRVCGQPFLPGARLVTCSKACAARPPISQEERLERRRERWRRKNWSRRAALRSVPSEPYTLAEIAARDGFRCQLCGHKVDMQITAPHPRSPSIDHVVPLAKGGDDTRANVQLAHRYCNTSKGVRGCQQLALVG